MTEIENFDEHFFDIRKFRPKKGQVMARFCAIAELVEGQLKKDLLYLLTKVNRGGESAYKVMRKLGCAIEEDASRIPKEMAQDLLSGMTPEEVEQKPYKYTMEMFFYTDKKYVPNNPHWETIEIINQEIFDADGNIIYGKKDI